MTVCACFSPASSQIDRDAPRGYAGLMWFDKAWHDRRASRKLAQAVDLVQANHVPVPQTSMSTKAISDLLSLVGPDGFFPFLRTTIDNQETLLESATFAYKCITGNANALSALQGIVQQEGDEGEADWIRVRKRSHPLNRFLRHPLGPGVQPEMTWSQVLRVCSMQLDGCGNSFWRILDLSGGQRLALEPLHPEKIEVIGEDGVVPASTGGRIAGYRILDDDRKLRIELPPEEIVHIVVDSPTSLVRGRAPLAVALRPMTTDRVAQERQKAFLKNRSHPGLVVNVDPGGMGFVNDEQDKATKKEIEDNFKAVEKDGGILLLAGANKLSASPLPSEVQYIETRAMARDEICAVFGVPLPIAGIFESALATNFQEARRIWWGNTLFPRLQSILDAFNRQAIQPRLNDQIRIWYSIEGTDIGLDMIEHRAEVAGLLVGLGYPTNVASAHVGLDIERIPELDQVNARFVTAGRVFNEQGTPVADSPAEASTAPAQDITEAPPALAAVPDS